jgi:homoserine O-acetyltransferase
MHVCVLSALRALAAASEQNMLGNGLSSSPSNSALRGRFPLITVADNLRLQHQLLTEHLGITSLALCYGYSMGAMQALAWAATHPGFVQRVLASCGTASCHSYNAVFLEGLLAVLEADAAFAANGGFFDAPPTAALRAFGRVYAGWGLPAEWYRRELWRSHGYASLDDFLTRSWCGWTCAADANNLRCQLRTWRDAVVEPAALGRITARVVYMPGAGDRYFPLEEAVAEAALVGRGGSGSSGECGAAPAARVVPLSAEWGHRAGDPYRPGQEADRALIARTVAELLAAPPGGSA